jgi:hypothetical protein
VHRTTRLFTILVVGLAVLISAPPGLAVDLPAGVVLDGHVTVVFTNPGDDDAPLAGATVELVALRPDLGQDEIVQELTGQTDADGRAEFTGVARTEDGAPPVTLEADAYLDRPNSCGSTERLSGDARALAGLEVTIAVEVESQTSSCVAFAVTGTVLDEAGSPFAVAAASVTITKPDGDVVEPEVTVDSDGAFRFIVSGWAGGAATAELNVTGETTTIQDPTDPDCKQLVALVANHTWELPSPTQPPPPEAVVAELEVISEACGSQGTPAPPQGPSLTLPPTDTLPGDDASRPGSPLGLLVGIGLIVAAIVAAATWATRVSRRGS